jgi:HSP20 family molecular chaperone IbpA
MTEKGKELQAKEKTEVAAPAEQTMTGPVFTPSVDIYETEKKITLVADMPGVSLKDLTIDLRDDVLTLRGGITPEDDSEKQSLLREYQTGSYFRQFNLSEAVDQNKIDANLKDGVLNLILPKVEKAVPRRITVKAA